MVQAVLPPAEPRLVVPAVMALGVSSLKKLLVPSEMFVVAEEPDGGGHVRTTYRKKAGNPH
jgi:hypothetical protein